MEKVTYKIPNINCDHCAHTIKTELMDLQGISKVEVDVTAKQVEIAFENPATPDQIKTLLSEINYPVTE